MPTQVVSASVLTRLVHPVFPMDGKELMLQCAKGLAVHQVVGQGRGF